MKDEIEVKFPNVDHAKMRKKLTELGATCVVPMRTMIRSTFDFPESHPDYGKSAFVRVRDEGDKITLTYKNFLSKKDVKEIELKVDNFPATVEFCEAIGLTKTSYQESNRETWVYQDCEIVLDEWPWLKPFIEVEAPSAEKMQELSEKLGFNFSDGVYGDVTDVYRTQYPHIPDPAQIGILPVIKFGDPLPDYLNPNIKLPTYDK